MTLDLAFFDQSAEDSRVVRLLARAGRSVADPYRTIMLSHHFQNEALARFKLRHMHQCGCQSLPLAPSPLFRATQAEGQAISERVEPPDVGNILDKKLCRVISADADLTDPSMEVL